ncbi:pentatricopeptide repeat-containing protein At1g11290, chloroplastic-like [Selaginella moellendorffii]|uniref:pentatricopeptide repeat-containing protein At1g11290, chloroplastic-like n=1 Tax=Selaginella moellendorffii TaxID=88036 RepID=UPI000D1C21FE|nr:pentatricopeptide repeat-containing protein At1g11290, chloroplastic-like [Selaginella moellendorffii]|eukprot:XP_024532085.1 pentatricopeptide repeat-containing protein At1g11290, chloroplastic-like [Selaginella moellendorffii]
MFAKCRSISDAKNVFDRMETKNRVTWNAMLAAYVQTGGNQAALELFKVMDREPDVFTFSTLFSACSNLRSLDAGRAIHKRLGKSLVSDLILQNALLNMYSKCGSLADVRKVFESMDRRDIVSWNAVIGAHVLHEQFREALSLFKSMKMKPDAITFAIALTACASLEALEEGREIHRKTVEAGLESVTMVRNALVTMYARCGSLEDAQGAFTGTVYRDVVSWSALIAAHAQHGQDLEAIKVYRRMNLEGIEADVFTFASILSAVSSPGLLPEGRTVHRQIISRGLESDTVVGTALVNMYARCGDVVTARTNFDNLCSKNIVSWNAMIAGYVQAGSSQEALLLYEKMQQDEAKPKADGLTFASVLAACSNLGEISRGRKLHDDVAASDFAEDLIVQNALVDMYGKCGNLVESRNVFEGIKSRSVISWTSMVTAYARHGHGAEAVELW